MRTAAALLAVLFLSPSSAADEYVFTRLVGPGDGFDGFDPATDVGLPQGPGVPMANDGTVALDLRKGGKTEIHVATGAFLRKLVRAGQGNAFLVVHSPQINRAGTHVAFVAVSDDPVTGGRSGLYVVPVEGGELVQVFESNGLVSDNGGTPLGHGIDDDLSVVWKQNEGLSDGFVVVEPARVVRNAAELVFQQNPFDNYRQVQVRDGVVAFMANEPGLTDKQIFRMDGATPVSIAADGGSFGGGSFLSLGTCEVNAAGVVLFTSFTAFGITGLFSGTGAEGTGITTLAIAGETPFQFFNQPLINDAGRIAFTAAGPGAVNFALGIWDGLDAAADRVIGPGDSLDGKVLASADCAGGSLNEQDQIAFRANAEDGTVSLWRADPVGLVVPEGAVSGAFVPTKVVVNPTSNTLSLVGLLDTGGLPPVLTGPGSISLGPFVKLFPDPNPPTADAATTVEAEGFELAIKPPKAGGSKSTIVVKASGDALAGIDPDGELELLLEWGSVSAAGSVPLSGGKYTRKTPPSGPGIFPLKARGKVVGGGKDSLSLTLGLPGLLPAATQPSPAVEVAFGPDYLLAVAPGAMTAVGDRHVLKDGGTTLILDPVRGQLTLSAKQVDLGLATTAGPAVVARVVVDGTERLASFRVATKKTSLKY